MQSTETQSPVLSTDQSPEMDLTVEKIPYGRPRREQMAEFVLPEWCTKTWSDIAIPKGQQEVHRAIQKAILVFARTQTGFATDVNKEEETLSSLLQRLVFQKAGKEVLVSTSFLDKTLPNIACSLSLSFYIRADAKQLFLQYKAGCFELDPLGGIIVMHTGNKSSRKYKHNLDAPLFYKKKDFRVHGTNGLNNGQWWPLLICALRDGAHGSAMCGISGKHGKGAYSILFAMQYAEDSDSGDEIWYTGTRNECKQDLEPTRNTSYLLDSSVVRGGARRAAKMPVRVIRSHNGRRRSAYCPRVGFRYDGVYFVESFRLLDADTKHYLFHLKRDASQDPIRWAGPEARPNKAEIEYWEREQGTQCKTD